MLYFEKMGRTFHLLIKTGSLTCGFHVLYEKGLVLELVAFLAFLKGVYIWNWL